MTQDFIEYPKLMERAVRGVVREVLVLVAQRGLPGMHHFYVTFRTHAPGVTIPDYLLRQYPEEMTIVIEHEFWDLDVTDEAFAVAGFVDPSVKFGLQFGPVPGATATIGASAEAETGESAAPASEPPPDDQGDGGRVVTLDRFRKK